MEKDKQIFGEKGIELLSEIINWWDNWINSDDPSEMEDPPIEEAREYLKTLPS